MQGGRGRGRGRGDPLFGFGDPFSGFGGMPMPTSLFGGRDPFDDPFFTHSPFGFGGAMLQPSPFGHTQNPFMAMGAPPFGPSFFGPNETPFMDPHAHMQSISNSSRGPIIEEVNSDDENEEVEVGNSMNPYGNQLNVMHDTHSRPQAQSFTFQSSSVTYGGSNGAYYTSSTTRRAGSDGVRYEEHKEADSVSGEAAHRISRGIHDKGHTLSRHLKSDGQVETMQTLHNINEDEVSGFEEAWRGRGGWAALENTHGDGDGGGRRRLGPGQHAHAHAQSSKAKIR